MIDNLARTKESVENKEDCKIKQIDVASFFQKIISQRIENVSSNSGISQSYLPPSANNVPPLKKNNGSKTDFFAQIVIWIMGFLLSIIPFIVMKIKYNCNLDQKMIFLHIFACNDLFLVYVGLLISPFCSLLIKAKNGDTSINANSILFFLCCVLFIIGLSYTFYCFSHDSVVGDDTWSWILAITNVLCFLTTCVVSVALYKKVTKKKEDEV